MATPLPLPFVRHSQLVHPHTTQLVRFRLRSGVEKNLGGGHGMWVLPPQSHKLKAFFNSERNSSSSASDNGSNDIPPGCSRIKVELTKPLGIAFEEDKVGKIFVGEVIKDGNAYKSGLVDAGDELIATSAIVYGSEEDYQGVMVRKGMQIVRLSVRGERFETVMAAIGTHPAYIKLRMSVPLRSRSHELRCHYSIANPLVMVRLSQFSDVSIPDWIQEGTLSPVMDFPAIALPLRSLMDTYCPDRDCLCTQYLLHC